MGHGSPSGWSIYDDYTLGAYVGLYYRIGDSDLLKFAYSLKNNNHNNTNNTPSKNKN